MTETELFLVLEADAAAPARLAAALARAGWSAVLIEPAEDAVLDAVSAEPLVELAQGHGAAALISADARLARTIQADGVHLPWTKNVDAAYAEARSILGSRFIVGAHAGKTRHDAIVLAEAGADYIAFGIPLAVKDVEGAHARRLDLVAWWSELCEPACVALDAATAVEAASLAEAGADFIGVRLPRSMPLEQACALIEEISGALALQDRDTES